MVESHPLIRRLLARVAVSRGEPVGRLIVDEVWLAAVDGTVESGERLPTARQVAIRLNISPRIVERAYEELQDRGVVVLRPGEGTFIRIEVPSEAERERHRQLAELCRDVVARAESLGFDLDDLIAGISEYRFRAGR